MSGLCWTLDLRKCWEKPFLHVSSLLFLFCNFPLCFRHQGKQMEFPGTLHSGRDASVSLPSEPPWHLLCRRELTCEHTHTHTPPTYSLGRGWVVCQVSIFLEHLVMPHRCLEVGALLLAPALALGYFGSWVIPAGSWKEEGIRSFPFSFHCHTYTHCVKWGHLLLIKPLVHSEI